MFYRDPPDIRLQCLSRSPVSRTNRSSATANDLIVRGWRQITVNWLSERDLRDVNAWLKQNCETGTYWRTTRSYKYSAEYWFKYHATDGIAAIAMFAERSLREPYAIYNITLSQMSEVDAAVGRRSYTAFGRSDPDGYRYDLRFADANKASIVRLIMK